MQDSIDILYKYVTSGRALTCIPEVGDGALRATQPAALNDPFECAVTPIYHFPSYEDENQDLAEVLTEINKNKPITAESVRNAREEYGSLFHEAVVCYASFNEVLALFHLRPTLFTP